MSAPFSAIRSAFVTKLQAYVGLPSVAWENALFTPTIGAMYLQPSLLPGEPSQVEIGPSGNDRHTGVFQISIFAPTGSGTQAMNTLRDGLIDHFKRGTILIYGAVSLTIIKAFPGPTMQETDWQHLPITIRYRTDVPA